MIVAAAMVTPVTSLAAEIIDCPLRDAPYSVELPFIDILNNPQAKAIAESKLPGISGLPEMMTRTEVPSFGTIMSLRNIAGMLRAPGETVEAIDAELAKLEVTDADRMSRCKRYDADLQKLPVADAKARLLVFTKINGFDHGPSVTAATEAIRKIAEQQGWAVTVSNNGGIFTPAILQQFDAVIWNNVSGDALTLSQRKAFEDYINGGGGYVGIHGSGGDTLYLWDWYANTLLGARFIGHPADPQFQDARINVEATSSGIGKSLMPGWNMEDEWYSFRESPRLNGADVIATLDESTYVPVGYSGQDLRMGEDHPIVWSRCIGAGRAFYSAIGHRPEVYQDANNLSLIQQALTWATTDGVCAR
ncbi:ThuA domain-containing protein [Pseudomaricurvus sp. HS19]|nr:ThuA domain-containing protein [Pseudomaricurvus sp. HS19]